MSDGPRWSFEPRATFAVLVRDEDGELVSVQLGQYRGWERTGGPEGIVHVFGSGPTVGRRTRRHLIPDRRIVEVETSR